MALFEGFATHDVRVGEVTVHCKVGGGGAPVLLLHGYPQTLAEWARMAPLLAAHRTVVCADLRGYGDSSKPPALPDFSNYSFRAMAADQVGLMKQLGFDQFDVVGHDRGGRVSHRMALDWPDQVRSLAVLDLVPTHDLYMRTNKKIASTYWQWYFLPLPAPYPETLIGANPDYYFQNCLVSVGGTGLQAFDPEMLEEYRRCWRNPEMIHASCNDYRAGSSIDLVHDEADLGRKLKCPVLALWGAQGLMQTLMDIEAVWQQRCERLRVGTIPGGHWFPEHAAEQTVGALLDFYRNEGF
ncbi:MAG: alpha/beta hydrolase [Rhodoferax sp.]|nr:alpha/beta hydrolase [Rhodoferax sp.]